MIPPLPRSPLRHYQPSHSEPGLISPVHSVLLTCILLESAAAGLVTSLPSVLTFCTAQHMTHFPTIHSAESLESSFTMTTVPSTVRSFLIWSLPVWCPAGLPFPPRLLQLCYAPLHSLSPFMFSIRQLHSLSTCISSIHHLCSLASFITAVH